MKLLILFVFFGANLAVAQIQVKYQEVTLKKISLENFYTEVKKEKSDIRKKGYQAAYFMLKAAEEKAVMKKKDWFVKGSAQLDSLIQKHPKNIELKWIRLTIQDNTPKFLKYNSSIQHDLDFIHTHVKQLTDVELKKAIQNYLVGRKK